jgi:peptidoglycan-associated lipoprotein
MSSTNHRIRQLILGLAMTALLLGCSRVPRDHWWQLWRPKRSADVVAIQSDTIPGPPGTRTAEDSSWDGLDMDPPPGELALGLPEPEPPRFEEPSQLITNLAVIYFDYDSFQLSPDARDALEQNAQWIRSHPELTIRVEGHCDERGTEEYNYNLGQKRAQAVREHLVSLGVDETRLHTWSWGELRPLDPGEGEMAWSRNRRAQFVAWTER